MADKDRLDADALVDECLDAVQTIIDSSASPVTEGRLLELAATLREVKAAVGNDTYAPVDGASAVQLLILLVETIKCVVENFN